MVGLTPDVYSSSFNLPAKRNAPGPGVQEAKGVTAATTISRTLAGFST
jgi:hypothetical protein